MNETAKALRLVEKLIAARLNGLMQRAEVAGTSKRAALGMRQRADELGLLIGEIKAARRALTPARSVAPRSAPPAPDAPSPCRTSAKSEAP